MAEYNLSKWLKDELGLKHMSEADMNNLVYHPRHGSLCRRLVKFWTESTLCTRKYPNFYARQECEEAERECQEREARSQELLHKLELQGRLNANTGSELNFLADQHKCLASIEDMLRTNTEALEEMANRPNFQLVQVGRLLEEPKYLGDLSLEAISQLVAQESRDPAAEPGTTSPAYGRQQPLNGNISHLASSNKNLALADATHTLTRRDVALVNEEYDRLVAKVRVMHRALGRVLASVNEALEQSDVETSQMRLPLERANIEQLEALKVPECRQVEVEADPEERELRSQHNRLARELAECNQQVSELASQYRAAKAESNERFKRELDQDLTLLKCLHQKEAALRGGSGGGVRVSSSK